MKTATPLRKIHNPDIIIAELPISIEAEQKQLVPLNVVPFLAEHSRDHACRAQITSVTALEWNQDELVGTDYDYDVYRQPDGSFVRAYRRSVRQPYYAISRQIVPGEYTQVQWLVESMPETINLNQVFRMISWEKLMLWHDRLLLHAACIDTSYGGILFSGPSGIGKSTQEQLWKNFRSARGINGDRPVLYRKECWRAYGSPMAGSSGEHFNESVPIHAIVMLEQGEENRIRKLSLQDAFHAVFSGTTVYTWDREYVQRALKLVLSVVSEVPVYSMTCTPDERAVETLEAMLKEEDS